MAQDKKNAAIRRLEKAFPDSDLVVGKQLIRLGTESGANRTASDFIKTANAIVSLRRNPDIRISRGFLDRTGPISVAEEAETTQILSQGGAKASVRLLESEGDSPNELARPKAIATLVEKPSSMGSRNRAATPKSSTTQRSLDRS